MQIQVEPKITLTIRCPTCGAPIGVGCQLCTGKARTIPHRDRRIIAKEADLARQFK